RGGTATDDHAASGEVAETVGAAVGVTLDHVDPAQRHAELGGHDLGDAGGVAANGRGHAGEDGDPSTAGHPHRRRVVPGHERAGAVGGLRGHLEGDADADPRQVRGARVGGAFTLPAPPALVVDRLLGQGEQRVVVPALDVEPGGGAVRELVRPDEVPAA